MSQFKAQFLEGRYYIDWVLILVLFLAGPGAMSLVVPHCRFFSPTDSTIGYPKTPDEVPVWALMSFTFVVPMLGFALWMIPRRRYRKPGAPEGTGGATWDMHSTLIALFAALAICGFVTDTTKTFAGRLRPDFLDRLRLAGVPERDVLDWRKSCAVRAHMVMDGRKSFPSGHASWSFASMTVLSAYWAGQSKAFRPRQARMWKVCLVILPQLAALYIAVTRTRDFHHNFSDVLAGAVVGLISGCCGYRVYYPSPTAKDSDTPYVRSAIDFDDSDLEGQQPVSPDD